MNHRQQQADVVARARDRLATHLKRAHRLDDLQALEREDDIREARFRRDRELERADHPSTWLDVA